MMNRPMFSRAHSSATTLVNPSRPCLVATYAALCTDPTSPCAEAMLTMRPNCRCFIPGSAVRIAWNAADRLMARIASHFDGGNSSALPQIACCLGLYFDRKSERQWTHVQVLRIVSPLLSFIPRTLRVLRILPTADHVIVDAGTHRCSAICPLCGVVSRRVHSSYLRKLRDLPSSGRQVTIRVKARRFRCLNAHCTRKTFAERLDDVASCARRTKRLSELQRYLALALGGEAGARMAARI